MRTIGTKLPFLAGMALLVGCASIQKKAMSPTEETKEDLVEDRKASAPPAEDTTAVLKAQPKSAEPAFTDDQRADFEKAVGVYQKIRKDGNLKGGECDEAASAFRRVADRSPNLLIARHNEAAVMFECGKRQDAERIWDDLARKGYAPALTQLGYSAWQSGQSSQAESYFTRAIQADPQLGSIEARINLAQILRDRARRAGAGERNKYNQEAVTHLRSVLALDGDSLQAYATLCHLYWDMGYPDGSILIGRQAIRRGEEIATGKYEEDEAGDLAMAGREKEKPAAGKKKGKKGDDDEKPSPRRGRRSAQGTGWTGEMKKWIAVVYNTLGLVELDRSRVTQAIGNFKEGVKLDPELYEARLNLAALSLKFRDYATAEENFRAVIGAQPRNYEATIGLGVALRGNRKFDEAEQQYSSAIKLDPNRYDAYFNLALLYQEYKGSEKPTLQKAQQYYRDFLSRGGNAPAKMRKDAEKRIKDIDELFLALEEMAKLQAEAEVIQKKAEEQQKKMEEEMKKMQEQEKKTGGAPPQAEGAAPPAPTAPPPAGNTSAVTPPPNSK